MKNFIIGLMIGAWAAPVVKEVSRQLAIKANARLEELREEAAK